MELGVRGFDRQEKGASERSDIQIRACPRPCLRNDDIQPCLRSCSIYPGLLTRDKMHANAHFGLVKGLLRGM
jgi:hypothetical protein